MVQCSEMVVGTSSQSCPKIVREGSENVNKKYKEKMNPKWSGKVPRLSENDLDVVRTWGAGKCPENGQKMIRTCAKNCQCPKQKILRKSSQKDSQG